MPSSVLGNEQLGRGWGAPGDEDGDVEGEGRDEGDRDEDVEVVGGGSGDGLILTAERESSGWRLGNRACLENADGRKQQAVCPHGSKNTFITGIPSREIRDFKIGQLP